MPPDRLGIEGASLNSLSNAYLIVLLPHALVTVSIVTALFTRMSSSAAADRHHDVTGSIENGAGIITFTGVLATTFLAAFGPLLGTALWDSEIIGQVISALGFLIVPFSIIYLTQRASLSYGNAIGPFIQAIGIAILTAIGSTLSASLLPPTFVVLGIAATIAAAHWALAASGWVAVRAHLRRLDSWERISRRRVGRAGVQLTFAVVGVGTAQLALSTMPSLAAEVRLDATLRLLTAAVISTIVYTAGALLTRDRAVQRLARRPRRRGA